MAIGTKGLRDRRGSRKKTGDRKGTNITRAACRPDKDPRRRNRGRAHRAGLKERLAKIPAKKWGGGGGGNQGSKKRKEEGFRFGGVHGGIRRVGRQYRFNRGGE